MPTERTLIIYSVPVPPELDAEVRRRIQLGRFGSRSEFLRTAIRAALSRADDEDLARERGPEKEKDMQTEVDVAGYALAASRKAAELMGMDMNDVGWLGTEELLGRIGRANGQVYDRLSAVLERYGDWRRFHGEVERTGKAGRLDADEVAELARLQGELDRTRAELMRALNVQ